MCRFDFYNLFSKDIFVEEEEVEKIRKKRRKRRKNKNKVQKIKNKQSEKQNTNKNKKNNASSTARRHQQRAGRGGDKGEGVVPQLSLMIVCLLSNFSSQHNLVSAAEALAHASRSISEVTTAA